MFEWVLSTPLFLYDHYLHSPSSLYVHIVVPECSSRLQDCSFKEFFIFQIHFFFFFYPKYFYEMAICCIIGITSYNNAVLYKLNTFMVFKKKQYFMV